jgi:nickel/cobalt exporter
MAATLTAVGLLLVRLRDRVEAMERMDRFRARLGGLTALMPVFTSVLVLVVGVGLAVRAGLG